MRFLTVAMCLVLALVLWGAVTGWQFLSSVFAPDDQMVYCTPMVSIGGRYTASSSSASYGSSYTSTVSVKVPTYHSSASGATPSVSSSLATTGASVLPLSSSQRLNSYGGGSSATATSGSSSSSTSSASYAYASASAYSGSSAGAVSAPHRSSIRTMASQIEGGVTTEETYAFAAPRRASTPPPPPGGGGQDAYDGPIDGHSAFATLPLLLMALIYVFIKKRRTSSCA